MADTIDKVAETDANDRLSAESLTKESNASPDPKTLSFAEQVIEAKIKPTQTSPLEPEAEFIKNRLPKDTDPEEAKKIYEAVSKHYETLAQEELEKAQVLSQFKGIYKGIENDVNFVDEDFSPEIEVVLETNSRSRKVMDTWTDPTRSIRTASLDSNKVVDYKGNIIEGPEDPYDMVDNPEYTDSEGNRIYGFEYVPADKTSRGTAGIKALYEGQEAEGEIVSRFDAKGWVKGNDLKTATYKVPLATTVNFINDLADTTLAMTEFVAIATAAGDTENSDFYKSIRDTRNKLKSWDVAKSDYDQSKLITTNNMIDLGVNVALQLLTARGLGVAMGKILGASTAAMEKLGALGKEISTTTDAAKKAKLVADFEKMQKAIQSAGKASQRSTLFFLGALASKEMGEEARRNGFSEEESAAIYLASLGGMYWVNKLSNLGFDRLSLNQEMALVKEVAKHSMAGGPPVNAGKAATEKWIKASIKNMGNGVVDKYKSLTASGSYISHMTSEATEESAELLMQELINHTSTAVAALGYDKDSRPKFKTAFDEGYWDQYFLPNLGMSALGGAIGGGIAKKFMPGMSDSDTIKESELPLQGDQKDAVQRIAYASTRSTKGAQWEQQLFAEWSKQRSEGLMGREDISTKYNEEAKRYYRMDELSAEDKAKYPSQAEVMFRAVVAQYTHYKTVFNAQSGKFDEIIKDKPELGFIGESKSLQAETMAVMNERATIYEKVAGETPAGLQESVASLVAQRDAVKPDDNGVKDYSKVDEDIAKIASASKLEVADVKRLMDIEKHISAVRSGEILERATINMFLTKEAYRNLFTKEKFESLINADSDAHIRYATELEELLAQQQVFDAQILKELQTVTTTPGATISDETKKLILDGNILLSAEVKQQLDDVLATEGVPIAIHKSLAMTKVLEGIRTILKSMPTESANTVMASETKTNDVLQELGEEITKNPDKVADFLLKNSDGRDLRHGATMDVTPEEKYDEVNASIAKLTYAFGVLKAISNATTEGEISEIVFDPNNLDDNSINNFNNYENLFHADHIANYRVADPARVLSTSDEFSVKTELREALSRVGSLDKGMSRNDFVMDFNDSDPAKVKAEHSTLGEKYQSLIVNATLDENKEPIIFGDLEGAQSLLNKIKVRKAQLDFIIELLPTLSSIHQLNRDVFKNIDTPMSYLTSYLSTVGIDLEQALVDESYRKTASNRILYNKILLDSLESKTSRLVDLAKNVSADVYKAYIGDATAYASEQVAALKKVFSRSAILPLTEKYPALSDIHSVLNKLSGSLESPTDDDLTAIFDGLHDIRLRFADILSKSGGSNDFIKELVAGYDSGSAILSEAGDVALKSVLLMAMSPSEFTFGRIRDTYAKLLESKDLKDIKLPTIRQLQLVEEVVTCATTDFVQYSHQLVKTHPTPPLPIAVFSGRQGTGKTFVVAVEAARIIQDMIDANKDKDDKSNYGILFSGHTKYQAQRIREAAEAGGVVSVELVPGEETTQYTLWDMMVKNNTSVEDLAKAFTNVSTIVFDEISYVEFGASEDDMAAMYNDVKNAPVLNGILAKLVEVNKLRTAHKQPPIMLIGLGDAKQGGYVSGMVSPRNPVETSDGTGTVTNVFMDTANEVIYRSQTELTHQFRFQNAELAKATSQVLTNLIPITVRAPNTGEITRNYAPIEFLYSRDEVAKDYSGVQGSYPTGASTWDKVSNDADLITTIQHKLDTDPDFSVSIISGFNTFEGAAPGSLLEKFLDKIKESPAKNARVNRFSLTEAQGSEATFVLFNMPSNFLPEASTAANDSDYKNKVNMISMGIGRAQQYTNIVFSGVGYNVTSKPGPVTKLNPLETAEFKAKWAAILMDKILKNYKTVPSVVQKINPTSTTPPPTGNGPRVQLDEKTMEIAPTITEVVEEIKQDLGLIEENEIQTLDELDFAIDARLKNGIGDPIPLQIAQVQIAEIKAEQAGIVDPVEFIPEPKEDNLVPISSVKGKTSQSDEDLMKEIEAKEGKVTLFTHVGTDVLETDSIASKVTYASFLYGSANVVSNVDYPEMFSMAMGLGSSRPDSKSPIDRKKLAEDDMSKFEYSMVTYEFVINGEKKYNHAIVAKHIESGKFLMLGTLGSLSMYEPKAGEIDTQRGKLYQWMSERESQLAATVTGIVTNGELPVGKELETERVGETIGYGDVKNKLAPADGRPSMPNDSSRSYIFYISTKISPRDIGSVITGKTVGTPVTSSGAILKAATNADTSTGMLIEKEVPSLRKLQPGETSKKVKSSRAVKALKDAADLSPETMKSMPDVFLQSPLGNNLFYKSGNNAVVYVITENSGNIPFAKINGKWVPVLGYNSAKKEFVHNPSILDKTSPYYRPELEDISKVLTSKGLEVSEDSMEIEGEMMAEYIAHTIGYSVDDVFVGLSDLWINQKLTTIFNNRANQFFGNTQLKLSTAKLLWNMTGGPDSVSDPYVITRGEHKGKTVVFYTFDKNQPLGEKTEAQIQSLFTDLMNNISNTTTRMTDERDGIGFIILDSEPMLLTRIYEMYAGKQFTHSKLDKVSLHGEAEPYFITLLATLQTVLNKYSPNKVGSLLDVLMQTYDHGTVPIANQVASEEVIDEFRARTDTKELAAFLDYLFAKENLGKLLISRENSELALILAEIESQVYYRPAGETEEEALSRIVDDIMKVNGPLLTKLGINKDSIGSLLVSKGKDTIGNVVVQNGKPKLSNKTGAITYVDPTTVKGLSGLQDPVPPSLNLAKMMALLNTPMFEASRDLILEQLDFLMTSSPGLSKGLFISPLCADHGKVISKAIPSTTVPLEDMLTTNVKQIKSPAITIKVDRMLEVFNNVPKRVETTEEEVLIKERVNKYKEEISKITTKGGRAKMYMQLNGDPLLAGTPELKLLLESLQGVLGKKVIPVNIFTEPIPKQDHQQDVIDSFDNIRALIQTEEDMAAWVAALELSVPVRNAALTDYLEGVKLALKTFTPPSDLEVFAAAKALYNTGARIPKLEYDGVDFKKMVEDFKSGKNLMGNRLAIIVELSKSNPQMKPELEEMITTNPADPIKLQQRDAQTKAELEEIKVQLGASLQSNLPNSLNILSDYFADIKDNYYNIDSKFNALLGVLSVASTISTPDSVKLIESVMEVMKTDSQGRMAGTFSEKILKALSENSKVIKFQEDSNIDPAVIGSIKNRIKPLLEQMKGAYFIYDMVSSNPSLPKESAHYNHAALELAMLAKASGMSGEEMKVLMKMLTAAKAC